ncbi:MAG: hypothetical protein IKR51_04370 [Oscillospiraceae bacterium]|nr:hypothetical protein [Oscillospiraceae bacterium]
MKIKWEDGFEISVSVTEDGAVVSANPEGLRSLAGILMSLAEAAPGAHVHLDEHNSLEDGSAGLVLCRA